VASPTLALPAAGGERRADNALSVGVLLLSSAGTMLFGALIAAYLHLRVLTERWPPRGVSIDQYLGNLTVITMLLAAVTVEWARHAVRRDERSQACAGLSVTLALGLAVLNLLSYSAGRARFDAVSHPYGLVVTAMVMLLGIAVGIGVALVTMTLFRVVGRQVSAAEPEQLRATAWYWHFCVGASIAVWYTVVVLK
jgi:heme/copper-type cytochrome/quinol oxidase subunit 3